MKLLILILFPFFSFAQSGAGAAMYTAYTAPKFAVLVNSTTLTNTEKARITRDTLNCNWARTALVTSQWTGSSSRYETFAANNLQQVVNISYYPNNSGENFPTGTVLTNYIDTLTLILNKYPTIGMVTALNEELNQSYHSGYITEYCLMLVQMYPVCKAKGIPLSDGGVAGFPLEVSTYRWVQGKYGQSAADQFGSACMTNSQITAAKNPGSNPTIEAGVRQIDTLLMYSAYVDFWNIHSYEVLSETNTQPDTVTQVSTNVFRYEKEFMEASSGKPCMTTETGQRQNQQSTLVTNMLINYLRIGTQYVIWYDGEDLANGTYPLTDVTTGEILATGTAWKNYITANQSNQ